MNLPQNPEELLDALLEGLRIKSNNDPSKSEEYRYVIYARKSTEDEDKQARSLDDQVSECLNFAEKNGLKVSPKDIIQESASAKESDTREKFRSMIDGLKAGKYDGVIAWHPDRLSRNLKDAGEVLDLLEKHTIRDLRFVSFTFTNNTSGKMLLGITFVLSKEFSDKLSDDITRGNRRSVEEGKYINKTKHGYYKDSNQYLQPDGENFLLIKKAFQMRINGETFYAIADFLNKNGYKRTKRNGTHELYEMDFRRAKDFMKDPIYTGVNVYGKSGGANLTRVPGFEPAISVPDFMKINKLSSTTQLIRLARKYRRGEETRADLMRGKIICAECDESMTAGITTKKNSKRGPTNYFYYRCITDGCRRRNKSVRAKVIMDYVLNFLKDKPFSSEAAYGHYAEEMGRVATGREKQARSNLYLEKTKKTTLENKALRIRNFLLDLEDDTLKDSYQRDLKKTEGDLKEVKIRIERLESAIKDLKGITLTYANFVELMEKMPKILASIKKMEELDRILGKVFLNFSVRGKKVVKMSLNEPFEALCDPKVLDCGDGGN